MDLVQTSTRLVTAATVAAVAITGVVAPTDARPGRAPVRSEPALQTFALERAPLGARTAAAVLAVGARRTEPFALLGATWADPHATLGTAVEVRTHGIAGRWTAWRALDFDEPGAPQDHGRGSTDPIWVGDSDGVQARVAAADERSHPLPAGLRLDLINPDADEPALRPVAYTEALALPARPLPTLITRAGWGANEAIVKEAPEYTSDVQVFFVHHTADSNTYSCGDSARMVRGIQAYHVRSKGWNDIGYNFLVDKCGKLFEGRRGGESLPVMGAHTLGFNSRSAAIAVIGNYSGTAVSARVKNVIAQVAAYKIGMYGNLANGRVALLSNGSDRYVKGTRVVLNRIAGHRDTGRTECPGNTLYAQLPAIRAIASGRPIGFGLLAIVGAVKAGAGYYTRGLIKPMWTLSTPSALMNRFDLIVDGHVVTSASRTNRNALLRLSPGAHTVTVRAVHLSGRLALRTVQVFADARAPAFTTPPTMRVSRGSLNGSVPIRLTWTAADAGGLRSVTLTRPSRRQLGTVAHSRAAAIRPAHPITWTLQATDRTGNSRTASTTRTALVRSEVSAFRSGAWAALRGPAYLSGAALRSTTARSAMTWTFTGNSAALAASRSATSGRVKIYVDGNYSGIVDLRSPGVRHRQAVWARGWSSSVRHTVKAVVEGTSGRPGVVLDGLVYVR